MLENFHKNVLKTLLVTYYLQFEKVKVEKTVKFTLMENLSQQVNTEHCLPQ